MQVVREDLVARQALRVTHAGARRLNKGTRAERRRRFLVLREWFKLRRPGESPIKLIALKERITVWTVYDVLRGRR